MNPLLSLMFACFAVLTCSTSEPDAEATLDQMFDEMAFKQNDSGFEPILWQTSVQSVSCMCDTCTLFVYFPTVTRPRVLNVHNRKVRLNKACGTIADCTFEELCDRVGPSHRHYWAISRAHTVHAHLHIIFKLPRQEKMEWWNILHLAQFCYWPAASRSCANVSGFACQTPNKFCCCSASKHLLFSLPDRLAH